MPKEMMQRQRNVKTSLEVMVEKVISAIWCASSHDDCGDSKIICISSNIL